MSEISENLQKAINDIIPKRLEEALNDALQLVENSAKIKCPVDDGTLRASIKHDIEKDSKDTLVGTVGTNVSYAPYVHEGTGLYAKEGKGRQNVPWVYRTADGQYYKTDGQKPTPFLQEAIDDNRQQILKKFEGII